jgi:hypothetical protein
MVCNVIDECRCYGYSMKEQFCGVRRGPNVLPCPKDCCAGGCPTKYPFRIIPRPKRPKPAPSLWDMNMDMRVLLFFTIILACIFLLLL